MSALNMISKQAVFFCLQSSWLILARHVSQNAADDVLDFHPTHVKELDSVESPNQLPLTRVSLETLNHNHRLRLS